MRVEHPQWDACPYKKRHESAHFLSLSLYPLCLSLSPSFSLSLTSLLSLSLSSPSLLSLPPSSLFPLSVSLASLSPPSLFPLSISSLSLPLSVSLCLCHVKGNYLQPEKRALSRPHLHHAATLISDFPATRTVRNKCLLFKPPTPWSFCYSIPS